MKKTLLIVFAAVFVSAIVFSCYKNQKATKDEEIYSVAGKKKRNAQRVSDVLFNTQGLHIAGTFEVSRGATEDTLKGVVTNWQGVWHHWNFILKTSDSTNVILADAVNYGAVLPNPVPSIFTVIRPHSGAQQVYFFGCSSDGGNNVAGKTLLIGQ